MSTTGRIVQTGETIPLGHYSIPGMELATILGIVLNVLPHESEGLAIDSPGFDAELQAEAGKAE